MTEDEMIRAMRAAGCCVKHDMPAGRDGRCAECDWQQAAYEENERDTRKLWNER